MFASKIIDVHSSNRDNTVLTASPLGLVSYTITHYDPNTAAIEQSDPGLPRCMVHEPTYIIRE